MAYSQFPLPLLIALITSSAVLPLSRSQLSESYYQTTCPKFEQILYADPRTRPFVDRYAEDQKAFFEDFAAAMQKLSALGVKGEKQGEVRYKCDAFNTLKT
uniref:peroxidase n=1 Tax=Kalanchoe fedtschenkoi TaxID=63787 RepID=A0A7N0TZU0_KALFE